MTKNIKRAISLALSVLIALGALPTVNAYAASTQNNVALFDYCDNGDYTTRLNNHVSVQYKPNGTGTVKTVNIKNLGWHYAWYDNAHQVDKPLYCIEPYRNYGASTSGHSVDQGVTVEENSTTQGGMVWNALPKERREAIALILLYSDLLWDHSISVAKVSKANNPNVPLRIATQFLIFEIVCGLRDPETFERKSKNECGASGDVFYKAGAESLEGFDIYYSTLVSDVQNVMTIPSFMGNTEAEAPSVTLSSAVTKVIDLNGVLADFELSDGNGVSFEQNENTLLITKEGPVSGDVVYTATKNIRSATVSSFNIWYMTGSSYQTCISLFSPSAESIHGYFKLNQPELGMVEIEKTTEDGKHLLGWRFAIYDDADCGNILSGPYTTDANGKISVTDLTAGTVYVKELGHNDSSINALYSCSSTNPQKVVLTAGETAKVSFHNKLTTGSALLVKQTNTGENLSGWKIGLYYDAACTNAVSGSPFTTGVEGSVTVTGLKPGTLYAKEIATDDPYWEFDTAVKEVEIVANQTATVTFTNTHYGRIQFQKTTNTGNHLGGWTFRVTDADGNHIGDYTTDEIGTAYTENLPVGRYTVVELSTDDNYWNCELGFHDVTVKAGETVVDEWINCEQGLVWFYKSTNTGENLTGWVITVYSDEACTDVVCTVTTGENRKNGRYLDPGIYYAKETGDTLGRFEDEYWLIDDTIYKFEIMPHEEISVTFSNIHYGRLNIRKIMDTDGPLDSWQFRVTDGTGKEISGSPFTSDKNGEIQMRSLLPGVYKIEELLPEDSLYYCKCENPQTVTVKQGETAEVSFTNALRPGKITIEKVDLKGAHLSGAKFLLEWSEDGSLWWPIEYSDSKDAIKGFCSNPDVVDGALTTTESGIIEWGNLHPGLHYRITELEAPEGYVLLTEAAYEDKLPADDLEVVLRVINCEAFTLPKTGSGMELFFHVSRMLCIAVCGTMLFFSFRKKRRA